MRSIPTGVAVLLVATLLGCSDRPAAERPAAPPEQPKRPDAPAPEAARQPRVRPTELTPEDRKAALPRTYPDQLRQGMSDEQLATDLDLRAWAFDYTGGPLRCWLEFEEAGQTTMARRLPSEVHGEYECDAAEGHVVFSIGRNASDRMKAILQKLGKDAHPESVGINLVFRSPGHGKSGNFGSSHGSSPLWFGWPGGAKAFTVQAPTIDTAIEGESLTLLRIECVEPNPAEGKAARKAVVFLKGEFGKAKK